MSDRPSLASAATPRSVGFGTRAIRAASTPPRVDQVAQSVPIFQSITYAADDAAQLGDILGDRLPGFAYSRIDNPTAAALGSAIAEVEGAEAGLGFSSGMAAIHATLLAGLRAGDRVVSTRAVYGSTRSLLTGVLARLGVEVAFVDPTDPDAVEAALTPSTRILYLETISNPTLVVADLAELAARAHRRRVRVVVDNTFASPYLCRPLELGADLVVESASKWIGGHSDVLAGVVAGSATAIAAIRAVEIDTGAMVAPFSAFLVLRGLETLHVRMDRHSQNALALARALESRPEPVAVVYPGLPSHPQAAIARSQLLAGGGMVAFELPDRAGAAAFIDALTIPPRTASLGSIQSMFVHPPSSTHRQLDDAQLVAAGIPAGLVRVSVGLEDIDDLLADVSGALDASRAVVAA
jgi:cystathionine beta-lyase/cystathionine gamma-synthase